MPRYTFRCTKCEAEIELDKRLDDKTVPLCCVDGCNIEMEKVISATSFHLKGSGWAKDGYSK